MAVIIKGPWQRTPVQLPLELRPNRLSDLVCAERDGTEPMVLGHDGFYAKFVGGHWSDTASHDIGWGWDNRMSISDPLAAAFSREARAAVPFRA